MLERQAGLSDDKIVEAHGSFFSATCVGRRQGEPVKSDQSGSQSDDSSDSEDNDSTDTDAEQEDVDRDPGCRAKYNLDWFRTQLQHNLPLCPVCQGLVKPDITFFGESLPSRFYSLLAQDFEECDLLLVLGTSLQVHPFASLIDAVGRRVPRFLINREKVGDVQSRHRGFDFSGSVQSVQRDGIYQGSTDDGCALLADLLDWRVDLDTLME